MHVATDAALAAAAAAWREAGVLALDTEFVRERTFHARLGLIQICDGRATYLVDPLPLGTLAPLADVLRDPRSRKVLHSASEDVEVLWRAASAVPAPLFDTQIAAAFAGLAPGLGYQRLVQAVIGAELGKGETRTNWMARPLSQAQLAYAVDDVTCLFAVHAALAPLLDAAGRIDWALEDSAELLDTDRFTPRPQEAYLRIKGMGRLVPRQLGALRLLAAWRDDQARRRDLPRGFVVKDDVLLGLATRQPKDAAELQKVPGLDPRQAARDGATWLALLEEARALPTESLPPAPLAPLLTPRARDVERALRDVLQRRADTLALAPEVLATRRTIETLVRQVVEGDAPRLPEALEGWRRDAVGSELLAAAAALAHR